MQYHSIYHVVLQTSDDEHVFQAKIVKSYTNGQGLTWTYAKGCMSSLVHRHCFWDRQEQTWLEMSCHSCLSLDSKYQQVYTLYTHVHPSHPLYSMAHISIYSLVLEYAMNIAQPWYIQVYAMMQVHTKYSQCTLYSLISTQSQQGFVEHTENQRCRTVLLHWTIPWQRRHCSSWG